MLVMTKRGLSLGSLSAARTTSALMMTRRRPGHFPALFKYVRSFRCAARVGALVAFRFQQPASTPHSWPSRPHIPVWAERPETPAQPDARNRHPGVPESVLQEYGDESSSPNAAAGRPHPPLLPRCQAVTPRRRYTVRLRR